MGWFAYNIYGGDETQSRHLDFLVWGKVIKKSEEYDVMNDYLLSTKTHIPEDKKFILKRNLSKIIKHLPKKFPSAGYSDSGDSAIEWQMLGALLVDNKIKPTKKIYKMVSEANHILKGKHAEDFNEPYRRKQAIRSFQKRLDNLYNN